MCQVVPVCLACEDYTLLLDLLASYSFYGAEYGIRQGMSAGIRSCSPQARFLVLLFAECRQILLSIVGVAVRIAVLLEIGSSRWGDLNYL